MTDDTTGQERNTNVKGKKSLGKKVKNTSKAKAAASKKKSKKKGR